jgi:hypothetical protein
MIQDCDIQPVKRGRPTKTDKQRQKEAEKAKLQSEKVTLNQAQKVVNAISNPTEANVNAMAKESMQVVRSNITALTKEQDIVKTFINKSIGVVAKAGDIVDRKLSSLIANIENNPDYLDEMSVKDIKDIADIGASQAKAIAILTGQTPEQAISQQTNNTVVFVDA